MPNWCTNQLRVQGSLKEKLKLTASVSSKSEEKGLPFDFNKIIPMPADEPPASDPLRQDWAVKNWGTKSNVSPERIREDHTDEELVYTFDTAWGPPEEIMGAVIYEFPELSFTWGFFEVGMVFAGIVKGQGGEITLQNEVENDVEECRYLTDSVFGKGTWPVGGEVELDSIIASEPND